VPGQRTGDPAVSAGSAGTPHTVAVAAATAAYASYTPTPPPPTGSLTVTTATSGPNPPSGYTVTVDGGQSRSLGLNASTTYTGLTATNHTVQLNGIPTNCKIGRATRREST